MYDATQHGNQHFYLYAKYWYQKSDQLNDLRRIMAHRCGIDQEHVRPVDIVEVLLEEVERLRRGRPHFLKGFLLEIRKEFLIWPAVMPHTTAPTLDEVIIQACLNELAHATVTQDGVNVLHLGEPDPSILPLHIPTPHPRPHVLQKGGEQNESDPSHRTGRTRRS